MTGNPLAITRTASPLRIVGMLFALFTIPSNDAFAQRLARSDDCAVEVDAQGGRRDLIFPTPLSSLHSQCATLLECEALSAQAEHPLPGSGAFRDWLESTSGARHHRACELRDQCIDNARALLQVWQGGNRSTPRLYPLLHPSWRERAWAAELAEALHTHATEAGLPGQARCPRLASRNHLRHPLSGRLNIAVELSKLVYGRQCDSAASCLGIGSGSGLDAWRQEQHWNSIREQDAREPLMAAAAGTLALEAQQLEQNKALREQADRLREHGETLASAQEVSTLTLASALNEALQTQRSINTIKSSNSWHESTPGNSSSSTPPVARTHANVDNALNITEALLLQARSTEELAGQTQLGLQQIADALLAASGQRAADSGAVARQIDPEVDLERIYPDAARFSYAVLLVPDPRIPRHRRGYDLLIASTNEGMLDAGYVLDRYAVPWQAYLDSISAGSAPNGQSGLQADDGQYGILVYRKDDYRSSSEPEGHTRHQLRVLYVVAESGTYGVQRHAFARALQRMATTIAPTANARLLFCDGFESDAPCPKHTVLEYQGGYFANGDDNDSSSWAKKYERPPGLQILVIGPAFSGSVTSIHTALNQADALVRDDRISTRSDIGGVNGQLLALAQTETLLPAHRSDMARVRAAAQMHFTHISRDGHVTEEELERLNTVLKAHPCEELDDSGCDEYRRLKQMLGAHLSRRLPPFPNLRLVSTSTTARSNYNIRSNRLVHHSLAVPDSIKLDKLRTLFPRGCVGNNCADRDVVIFSEASTFGSGLCPTNSRRPQPDICGRAYEIRFPANIADIRARQQGENSRTRRQTMDALGLASSSDFLDLAQGSENGSEYPDSQRSALTSATSELELQRSLQQVQAINPRLVIIAATDVRDRLFLVNQLRDAAPRALLVDLEADALMAHPRIIHASRGMLMLSSGTISQLNECCESSSIMARQFANDRQRAAHAIMRTLSPHGDAVASNSSSEGSIPLAMYVPTRDGLRLLREISTAGSPQNTTLKYEAGAGRAASLMLLVIILLISLSFIARGIVKGNRMLARVNDERFSSITLPTLIALFITGLLLYRNFLPAIREQAQPYLMPASTGFAYAHALALGAAAIILAGFVQWMIHRYREQTKRLGTSSGTDDMRPVILCEHGQTRRYLPGADLVSWPLYLALGVFGWLVIGSIGGSICMGCWPRTTPLSPFAELTLMLVVMLLAGNAAWSALHAFAVFRQILGSATRIATLIKRGLGGDLPDWCELPPTHLRDVINVGSSDAIIASENKDARGRCTWLYPRFAQTPFLARPSSFGWALAAHQSAEIDYPDVQAILCRLNTGYADSLATRLALGLHLATLVAQMRLLLIASLLSGACVVLIGYLYPVTDRDQYLLFSLSIMALSSVLIFYAVLALERLPTVSRLLCNTPKGLDLNWTVLASIGSPLLILLAVLLVMEVPGVLEWSGGLAGVFFGWIV